MSYLLRIFPETKQKKRAWSTIMTSPYALRPSVRTEIFRAFFTQWVAQKATKTDGRYSVTTNFYGKILGRKLAGLLCCELKAVFFTETTRNSFRWVTLSEVLSDDKTENLDQKLSLSNLNLYWKSRSSIRQDKPIMNSHCYPRFRRFQSSTGSEVYNSVE